ncbi:MAG: hypothetical protein ABJB01_02715 [Rudaea sp.]
MHAEGSAGKTSGDRNGSNPFISDVHNAISRTDVSRLRDVFNDAIDIPIDERSAWLIENISDPDERQAIATLLLAYDGEGFFDVDIR